MFYDLSFQLRVIVISPFWVPLKLSVCAEREAMNGRRDGPLMRNSSQGSTKSKIGTAIFIGVLLGCAFAFLFPGGIFTSSSLSIRDSRSVKFLTQVFVYTCPVFCFLGFPPFLHYPSRFEPLVESSCVLNSFVREW